MGEEADSGVRIEPFISVGSAIVYVRDQTLSRQFYLEKLGFRLVFDSAESDDAVSRYFRSAGLRWITVAPMFSVRSVFSGSLVEDEFLNVFPPKPQHLPSVATNAQAHRRDPRVPPRGVRLHIIEGNAKPLGDLAGVEQTLRSKGELEGGRSRPGLG